MLSEEEIIKKVDDFIDGYRQYDVRTGETKIPYKYGEGQRFCYKEEYEAIQGLLDLYEKEKEKNKRIKDGILLVGRRSGKSNELKVVLEEYISKDKIKAKIEEYENKRDKAPITSVEYDIYICIIEVFQSLLEKE